jgi:hypothetical protein
LVALAVGDGKPDARDSIVAIAMLFRRSELPGVDSAHPPVFWVPAIAISGMTLHRRQVLRELQQRIRDVSQGSDGFLYVLTAENDGALMRMEPWTK